MNNLQSNPVISIVVPLYNEEDVVDSFLDIMTQTLSDTNETYEIVMVNDGSSDNTLPHLLDIKSKYSEVRVINFSRNFGKEAALTAGLDHALGDVVIPIDCDLQDPPELIHEMLSEWRKGYDVVIARRANRDTDSYLKRLTAQVFYKIHNKISDTEMPANVGDYRLMTRKVVEAIKQLPENQRFMKGIFSWVGFKTKVISYTREKRAAGSTSFNYWKLWNFALDGITSFSTAPLRVWFYMGLIVSLVSFLYGVFIVAKTILMGVDVPGYASILTGMLFIGGIQLLGIGIMGEYIGRIYQETKNRPIYIIDREY